ncbi:hypothetical protein Btru_038186 [Bulinus truncatus]|nr:hypothetical protein Btru_038186 [Bulinus truncatus]
MAESETKTSGQSPETDKKVDMRSKIKQEPDTPGKIMVSGIPKNENYADADLEKEFAPFGRITEVNIIRDRRSNLPRGFAFITYENPQDAEDAIKALEGKNLGGETPIHCEQAVIGLRRSKQLTDEVRGGGRGRGGRGGDRGGRGGDRGRGRGGERGARGRSTMERGGRGRGFMERAGRGMRGRPHPDRYAEMGGGHQDNYYDEYYEPEPAYDS